MASQETSRGKAQQAKSAASEKAQEATAATREKTAEAADQAKGRLRAQVDQRSSQAGEQVTSTALDLRSVGDELRKQGKDTPARVADQAAERAERLGGYLKESDAERNVNDVEEFTRRQPWAVAAGGLALGFLTSRFLKASSGRRYESSLGGHLGDGARPRYASAATGMISTGAPSVRRREVAGGQCYNDPEL